MIDSLSHAWAGKGGILEFVDNAGKRNQGGGNFGAWRDATPRHNSLVDAILGAPLHIICTLRSKVEYVVENVGGRNQVRKVGLQPVQRDGLEYEFTVVGDVTQDHDLVITKTRAAFLKDAVVREAGEDLGRQLSDWLNTGSSGPAPVVSVATSPATVDRRPTQEPSSEEPLRDLISRHIGEATTVRTIGKIVDRIDILLSEGKLVDDDWSELTDLANARHDEIKPRTEAAT